MSRRDAFRGPGKWALDLGIYKSFKLREGWTFQGRCELYNALNHSNFIVNKDQAEVSTNPFFVSARKVGQRNVQLAVKIVF